MNRPRTFVTFLAVVTAVGSAAALAATGTDRELPPEYGRLKDRAEAFCAEGSYARARQLYERASDLKLPAAEARWVAFRVADVTWRAQAGSRTHDDTVFERARRQLEQVVAEIKRPEDRDRVWAEAQESLGDFWWARQGSQNWHQGWQHYQQALDWWAGRHDLELARRRYLDMVWSMAEPDWQRHYGSYRHYNIPLDVLENARRIARAGEDRSRAHYLLAMGLRRHGGSFQQRKRIESEFEAALDLGPGHPWYDDALYHYAQWLASQGRVVLTAEGQWRQEPDFVEAVKLYTRLVREFKKGQTQYWDDARNQIEQITSPQLSAGVSNIFLPGSEIRFALSWRNVGGIDLALYRVDLTRDVNPAREELRPNQWISHIDATAAEKVKAWRFDTKDTGEHKWGQQEVRLDEHLPRGAYLLLATSNGKFARELVLVTDVSVVLKAWRGQVLAYVCDALDGSPIPEARVHLWNLKYLQKRWTGSDAVKETDGEGLCRFEVDTRTRGRERCFGYLVTTTINGRQAFALGGAFGSPRSPEAWKVYATTDRPAYRPQETVHWKITARTNDGSGYATPGGRVVRYEISGPRGKVDEGVLTLNAFGSAWSDLELGEALALGEYQVTFRTKTDNARIGSATLFRLEEYKLPEFEVAVATPTDDAGQTKAFRLGETVEVDIEATYYFGGPVANANVEVLVYQKPFYHGWMPPREYPWCYSDRANRGWWGGPGQVIKQETLKTDGGGRAVLSFETPLGGNQDLEYRVEARVTDASRREISGATSVRVTRQRYYVHAQPRHNLYRPGDKLEIDFKTIDANDRPVSVQGTVKVTRDRWVEVWVDPAGREVTGWNLRAARKQFKVFPPPPDDGEKPWEPKFQGYSSQEILTREVTTDAEGEATLSFTARDDGYYRVSWAGVDDNTPITAGTAVWVADRDTTELGYRPGAVEIIVDKDTFRAGQTAAVMLSVPTNDRFVLFSVEGDDMHSCRLVHVTGTVKLIELPIADRHIPNVYLQALMVSDGQLFADREEVIVPPVEHFLEVEVTPDQEAYEPRDEGTLTVVTRDVDGNPVAAEVSLGLVDESVYYIQQPYAGDPRPHFFDYRQATHVVRSTSTFNQKQYIKLLEVEDGRFIDARLAGLEEREGWRGDASPDTRSRHAPGKDGGGGAIFADPGDRDYATADMAFEANGEMLAKSQVAGAPAPSSEPPGRPGGAGQEPAVVVRSDFRSTIFWKPDVVTDKNGKATVTVQYADSLTRWKATACAATAGSRFGLGAVTTRTHRPLIARLQGPRFFVVGDTVTLSGIFNNNTDEPMTVRPELEVEGLKITGSVRNGRPAEARPGPVHIPAGGEARVDWLAAVEQAGEARLRLVARSSRHADAMEKSYTVHEHGVDRFIARSGKVRGEQVTVKLDIPAERRPDSTKLSVTVASSMAVTMLDALPYLVDYPYGCTEQTMSRFLPAVVTARTLGDMGLSPDDALGKVFGGIEQAFVDKTHPKGRQKRQNIRKLDLIVNEGLERLYDFQHGDGGWGWWKHGESDHFMTAYILWGLCLAREAGLDVRGHVMDRAARFLEQEIVERENHYDMQAWMLHALAEYHAVTDRRGVAATQAAALRNLWQHRDGLNAYTRALLALSAHGFGDEEKAQVLVRNLSNGVKRDDAPDTSVLLGSGRTSHPAVIGTAHWGADGVWWRWSDGGVEATAFALRALLAIDPDHELIEPVTNWLVKNRRGAQWSNTRDTTITVLALNDYLRASGELEPEFEYDLLVNGQRIARKKVTAAEALAAPSRFEIDPVVIRDGTNEIRIVRRNGEGPIYFAAEATFFSLEEPVPPAGNEIFVRRDYYKLVPRETLLKGYVYDRTALTDGDYVTTGERVEVVVTIEAKNDYEYLVFEDLKPAGLEAVQIRSGEAMFVRELKSGAVERRFAGFAAPMPPEMDTRRPDRRANGDFTGRQRWVHQELRDRKVALFVDKLSEGVWQITYDLRAEVPGHFHALPVLGHAMYVPEIRCNSGEIRITVNDRPADNMAAVDR
ncbi:MAG: alpha-2-macroglobulin family protein [Planctomycetota bacterium]|jgi:uncharacterized protein YfaS (alpha-2-macroglobulin family)/tetratricopeptide (TPR) repeat protein